MHRFLPLVVFAAVGCASGRVSAPPPVEPSTTVESPPAPREAFVPEPAFAPEPSRVRPRISQTVTLGEANVEPLYGSPVPPPSGPNVVVNNNIIVAGTPYGYGYGAYGYGASRSRGHGSRGVTEARSPSSRPMWGASGWEGASGRPASPGQTPAVGGNWSSVPSYGPRQMK